MTDRSLELFPERFVNKMVENISKEVFGEYEFPFYFKKIDPFFQYILDMRMVRPPHITKKYIDFFFYGECTLSFYTESRLDDMNHENYGFNKNRM